MKAITTAFAYLAFAGTLVGGLWAGEFHSTAGTIMACASLLYIVVFVAAGSGQRS
jgi:hypothetical protein